MRITELRQKDTAELTKVVLESKRELFNLRFQRPYGQLEKTHRIRQVRRLVAQASTLLGELTRDPLNKKTKTTKKVRSKSVKASAHPKIENKATHAKPVHDEVKAAKTKKPEAKTSTKVKESEAATKPAKKSAGVKAKKTKENKDA
jgi:large subunit ribosomal protein L29